MKRKLIKAVAFALLCCLMLSALSTLSIAMGRSHDPINNYSTAGFFAEPEHSLDVLTIGSSSVYCSVSPLSWWHQSGFTGYTWGEPCLRIFETYDALKQVYRRQTPKVVFLEMGVLYWDHNDIQAWDSMVKSRMEAVFPVIAYHNNISPGARKNLGSDPHSVVKGYLYHREALAPSRIQDYMQPDDGTAAPIPALCARELSRCIALCRAKGSAVVLLSIPEHKGWNMSMHREVANLAAANQVEYLDLNLELRNQMDWSKDTVDGGIHLNGSGAQKVTDFLSQYLTQHFQLPDHRNDPAYAAWNKDYQILDDYIHGKKAANS